MESRKFTIYEQCQQRAQRLRLALLHEWQRVRIELAGCGSERSVRRTALEGACATMGAILKDDAEQEAAIHGQHEAEIQSKQTD